MNSYKKFSIVLAAICGLSATSCKKLLEQDPKSSITPQFFTTAGGVLGGITGVYSDLRNLWGQEYFSTYTNAGTDETLAGSSAGSALPFYNYAQFVGNIQNVYNGPILGNCYQDINTLNGVLQYGPSAFADAPTRTAYLAQAKFLRALLYFVLVQNYGDVPLHTTFITTATLSDTRTPALTIYAQIIKDLTEASTELQSKPGETITSTGAASPFGGKAATKATALYLLSKVYLTRAWLNGETSSAGKADFQSALTTANTLIANKGTYGVDMWQDYADAFRPANDYGKETLFVVDHSSDSKYGDFVSQASSGKINEMAFIFRPNYPALPANYPASTGTPPMTRDVANGRPFIRIRPNTNASPTSSSINYILDQAFADRSNDYRYWNTFQVTWITNTPGVSTPRGALTLGVDTAIWMPPYDPGAAKRASFKGIILVPPTVAGSGANAYNSIYFPSVKKFDDPSRTDKNDPSNRPVVVFRFSEIYLIAAEAALELGDPTTAAQMINVVRTRAAYRPTGMPANAVTNMQVSPGQVTIDFILDERTREFYGEMLRFWDLTRTKSLVRRVKQYNAEAAPNIQDFMTIRPIPQTEIDAVTQGPKFPQNPGY